MRYMPRLLLVALLPVEVWAQNSMEISILAGPAFTKMQTIAGTGVTLYGATGYVFNIESAFPVTHESRATLWADVPFLFTWPPAQSATIPGSASLNVSMIVPAARLMVHVRPRVSIFGALGAGYCDCTQPALISSANGLALHATDTYHGVIGAGGGLDFRMTRHFSLRADVRDYVTGRNLSGIPGRNHLVPLLGVAAHY